MLEYGEQGLQQVPPEGRQLNGWHLSLIWGGISFCLPTFMIGALPVPGLSWGDAVSVNIIGNLVCWLLIALSGYTGIKYRLPTVVICRRFFGEILGGVIVPMLVFISTVGWFGLMLSATADGIMEIFDLGSNGRVLLTLFLGFCMTVTASLGNRVIVLLGRCSVPLLIGSMLYFLFKFITWEPVVSSAYIATGEIGYLAVINLIISGYIVGALCASDFSRYVSDQRANWIGTFVGVFVVSLFLSIVAMYAKLYTGEWNPLKASFVAGFGPMSAFIIVFSAWTTNQALIYSAGLALSSFIRDSRLLLYTIIAGGTGTIVAFSDVVKNLESFLSMLSYVFPGILGIYLSHFFLVEAKIASQLMERQKNVACMLSLLCSVFAQLCLVENSLSSLVALVAGGTGYVLYLRIIVSTRKLPRPAG